MGIRPGRLSDGVFLSKGDWVQVNDNGGPKHGFRSDGTKGEVKGFISMFFTLVQVEGQRKPVRCHNMNLEKIGE